MLNAWIWKQISYFKDISTKVRKGIWVDWSKSTSRVKNSIIWWTKSIKFCGVPTKFLSRWTGCQPRCDPYPKFTLCMWSNDFHSGPAFFFNWGTRRKKTFSNPYKELQHNILCHTKFVQSLNSGLHGPTLTNKRRGILPVACSSTITTDLACC